MQVCIVGEDGAASLAYIPGETLPIVGVEDGNPLDCLIGDVGPPVCLYLSAPGICVGRVHVEHVKSRTRADLDIGRKEELERSGEEPIVMVARPRSRSQAQGNGGETEMDVGDSVVEYRDLSRDGLLLTAALTAIGVAALRIITGEGESKVNKNMNVYLCLCRYSFGERERERERCRLVDSTVIRFIIQLYSPFFSFSVFCFSFCDLIGSDQIK